MNGGEEKRHLVAFARTVTMFVEYVVKVCARGTLTRQVAAADIAAIIGLSAKANSQAARAGLSVELVCRTEHGVRASSLV